MLTIRHRHRLILVDQWYKIKLFEVAKELRCAVAGDALVQNNSYNN